jgi:hypothetical protein
VPVGYAYWQCYGATAHLIQLVTDPRARGRGVGAALMEAVRAAVVAEGCSRWYLNVKRENATAQRLYRRHGLAVESECWVLRFPWALLERLPGDGSGRAGDSDGGGSAGDSDDSGIAGDSDGSGVGGGVAAATLDPADDAPFARRFGVDAARFAVLRARPGRVVVGLRERGEPVGFAVFDPAFPGAHPLRVARPTLARPLLEACRRHADLARFDFLGMNVEGDAALKDALLAAGAQLTFDLLQMSGALV